MQRLFQVLKFSIIFTIIFKITAESFGQTKLAKEKIVDADEIDGFLKNEMKLLGLPGLSIALFNDAEILYYKTLGVSNIETGEPINSETLFDAGSMSKSPFAFLVMKMVEKKLLDLDIPLFQYLENKDIAYDERYKLITARMVLSHTSGFPNWRRFNKDKILDIKFTPGTQYLYSGEGYEYLADVIAHLNGIQKNELQNLFEKEVAAIIDMKKAYFIWNDFVAKHQARGHIDGKLAAGWGINPNNPNFFASYSLQSEAKSYAHFLMAIMRKKGLQPELFNEMLKPVIKNSVNEDNAFVCLGIRMQESDLGHEYYHDGFNKNFYSAYRFNPDKKIGYVFFTNCNNGNELNKRLELFLKTTKFYKK